MKNNFQLTPELQMMLQKCGEALIAAQAALISNLPADFSEKTSKIGLMVSSMDKLTLPNMPVLNAVQKLGHVPSINPEPRYSSYFENFDNPVVFRIPLDNITVKIT